MTFPISKDIETLDYIVSIDFYEHQISDIIGPTSATFEDVYKTRIPKYVRLFILHLRYLLCGCDNAVNCELIKFD